MQEKDITKILLLGIALCIASEGIRFLFSISENIFIDMLIIVASLLVVVGVSNEWIDTMKQNNEKKE